MNTDEKPQCKIVYFNRRETDLDCDKVDESEIFSLRNMFESKPDEYVYTINYYAPVDGNVYGLYKKQIIAATESIAIAKFNELFKDADFRLRIKSIKLSHKVS